MKYLLLDTNNYIICSIMTREGESSDLLDRIKEQVASHNVRLLLPEVIELEYQRKIDKAHDALISEIEDAKKAISNLVPKSILYEKQRIMNLFNDFVNTRRDNLNRARHTIDTLFTDATNTIHLPLTPEIFLAAYMRVATGVKPAKAADSERGVSNDCIIVESVRSHFDRNSRPDVDLIICSDNTKDFGKPNQSDNAPTLHPEIVSDFRNLNSVTYYANLQSLLADQFKTEFSEEEKNAYKNAAAIAHTGPLQGVITITGAGVPIPLLQGLTAYPSPEWSTYWLPLSERLGELRATARSLIDAIQEIRTQLLRTTTSTDMEFITVYMKLEDCARKLIMEFWSDMGREKAKEHIAENVSAIGTWLVEMRMLLQAANLMDAVMAYVYGVTVQRYDRLRDIASSIQREC